jgi:hypothetical protein
MRFSTDCWGAYPQYLDPEGHRLGQRHTQQTCLESRRGHSLACPWGELYGRPGELTGTVYTCGAYCPWERLSGLRRGGSQPAPKGVDDTLKTRLLRRGHSPKGRGEDHSLHHSVTWHTKQRRVEFKQ